MNTENVPVGMLIPWPGNPRQHEDHDVAVIVKSIKEFGFTNPILAQRGSYRVIAGHGRLQAAKKMGLAEVPVIFLDITDQKKIEALTVMDNRSAELSRWDYGALKDILARLDDGAFDVSLTGFDKDEISKLFDGPEEEDEDESGGPSDPVPVPVVCPKCRNKFVPRKRG